MNTLTLLSLPPEVRLQIYSKLFRGSTVRANAYHYPQDDGSQGHISFQPQTPLLNVLLSCRTIHDEAIVSFYTLSQFKFERHSVDALNWSPAEIAACFPEYYPLTRRKEVSSTRNLVRYVHYAGNDAQLVRSVGSIFPNLVRFEFDLNWDHLGVDQTNFDRAMKYALRNREWRHAIKDALEYRFPDGMTRAVWDLQKTWRSDNEDILVAGVEEKGGRCFQVMLLWRLAYRFVEFEGQCDLDEWVLKVWDPDGRSKNVYDIRQDPLFFEMG